MRTVGDVVLLFAVMAAGFLAQVVAGLMAARRKWPVRKIVMLVGCIGLVMVEVMIYMLGLGIGWLIGAPVLIVLVLWWRIVETEGAETLGAQRRAAARVAKAGPHT